MNQNNDVQLAYIILAYNRATQLKRLIERLSASSSTFCVHIDQKMDITPFREALSGLTSPESLTWVKRETCYWGDFGRVAATLNGLSHLLTQNARFDYVFLLSGQDYPIKPLTQIQQYLSQHWGQNFVRYFEMPAPCWGPDGGMDRIGRYWFQFRGKMRGFPSNRRAGAVLNPLLHARSLVGRRLPAGLRPYGGSSWWCITRRAAEFVVNFVTDHPDVVRFYRRAYVPDEMFFQTILANSNLQDTLANVDLTYVDWDSPAPRHPTILTRADLEALLPSDKLFARKFDVDADEAVLDIIDGTIHDQQNTTG
jgi:hypothetical protein